MARGPLSLLQAGMFGQVPRKARSPSQRVPRKGLWGVQVLHQHTVQQVGVGRAALPGNQPSVFY